MKCAGTILIPVIFPFLFSCSNTKKLQAPAAGSLPPLPESVINIPLKIYIKPFLEKAETLAPLQFTSGQWPDYTRYGCDFRYKYRFTRSAMRFTCVNNQVTISLTGNYQVAGSKSVCLLGKQVAPWISGSCGFNNEALRRVDITIRSTLRFLPDYTLRSSSGIEHIYPVNKCTVTFLSTDITGMVMNTVRTSLTEFAASLDHDIAALNISPFIRTVESSTGKKIALHDYGYLSIRPSSVKMGKISYAADTLYLTAGFSCYPELTSDSTGNAISTPLPPLVNADISDGCTVYANVHYDYPFVSRLLTKAVQNRVFTVRGEKVRIENIEARGLDNNAIEIKAAFSGSRKGVLYFTGTPAFDANNQVISVPDLNFSLQSKSFVLNAGKTFFNKRILRAIRNQAVINISSLYLQHKTALDGALTHRFAPTILSSGSTSQLSFTGMEIRKDQVLFQVCVKGNILITGN